MQEQVTFEAVPLAETERQDCDGYKGLEEEEVSEEKHKKMSSSTHRGLLIATSIFCLTLAMIVSGVVWSKTHLHADASPAPLLVHTPVGIVKGTTMSNAGYPFVAYISIPFAKPPLGPLRFKRPRPVDSSSMVKQIINAEDYKKSCWSATQKSTSKYYGEDCLYLNVYVPDGVTGSLPVIVWIHGGGFVAGSTFPEPGKMVSQGNVIVVSINYRLGILGFLTTEDDDFPTNNGLWDQYMALKWVHQHIEHFHGDPNSITLLGESAGAISTALHVLSPISSGLFHKVILQSGAMTSPTFQNRKSVVTEFATLVGCTSESGTVLKDCLHKVSVEDILMFSKPEPGRYVSNEAEQQIDFVWLPVVDGDFVLDSPLKLINNNTFLEGLGVFDKQYMIGVLNDEGALITKNFLNPIPVSIISNSTFFKDLEDFLLRNRYHSDSPLPPEVTDAVNTFYTGGAKLGQPPTIASVLGLAGDLYIVVPAMEAALALTNGQVKQKAKVFLYHFDYCPETSKLQAPCLGHGDAVPLQFPSENITDPVKAKLSDSLISILTRFATSSDPGAVIACGWPEFEPNERKYLRLSPTSDVRSHLYNYRMQLWFKTVPCLQHGGSFCD